MKLSFQGATHQLEPGESFTSTLTEAGTYAYSCTFPTGEGQSGNVVVE